ncbi:MAG TPA: hypothetical protein VLC91_14390 [Spongiibacteraceae bacterium]|nr:hypothetical protein [Spongiibacteraceae bacterium]
MPPSPTYEAATLVSTALVSASSIMPGEARYPIEHSHERIDSVCIQYNAAVALADFVPAVQGELRNNRVDSRLYEAGMQPAGCQAILYYTAFLDWDQRALSSEYAAYLTFASMTLRSSDGRVLASANYQSSELGLDKWSPTQRKISGMVKALLAGN